MLTLFGCFHCLDWIFNKLYGMVSWKLDRPQNENFWNSKMYGYLHMWDGNRCSHANFQPNLPQQIRAPPFWRFASSGPPPAPPLTLKEMSKVKILKILLIKVAIGNTFWLKSFFGLFCKNLTFFCNSTSYSVYIEIAGKALYSLFLGITMRYWNVWLSETSVGLIWVI